MIISLSPAVLAAVWTPYLCFTKPMTLVSRTPQVRNICFGLDVSLSFKKRITHFNHNSERTWSVLLILKLWGDCLPCFSGDLQVMALEEFLAQIFGLCQVNKCDLVAIIVKKTGATPPSDETKARHQNQTLP